MTSDILTLTQALAINRKQNIAEKIKVNIISDNLVSQTKIFINAYLALEDFLLDFEHEEFNGFIKKCYSTNNSKFPLTLIFIDSSSIGIDNNLRNFSASKKNNTDNNIQTYIDALNHYIESNGSYKIICPIRLKSNLMRSTHILHQNNSDRLWVKFISNLSDLYGNNSNVFLTNQLEIDLDEKKFVDTGEYLVSNQASKFAHDLAPIVHFGIKGVFPKSMSAEKKLIITDLDNTFWSGIIGDDGFENISFDESIKGKVHWLYQKLLFNEYLNGVQICACSKNDPEVIKEAFSKCSFIFPAENFTIIKANWLPKSENIKNILKEINLTAESAVFIDDNLMELEEVQTNIQGLTCIQFPKNSNSIEEFLNKIHKNFLRPRPMTSIDQRRNSYATLNIVNEKRSSLDDNQYISFLKSLEMKLSIEKIRPSNEERAFELLNKTNQFNLTGNRIGQNEFKKVVDQSWVISLTDRQTDHGIIGVLIIDDNTIKQFVLSCRVFSRRVEDEVLKFAHEKANHILYMKTDKNKPTFEFLLRLGIEVTKPPTEHGHLHILDLPENLKIEEFPGEVVKVLC